MCHVSITRAMLVNAAPFIVCLSVRPFTFPIVKNKTLVKTDGKVVMSRLTSNWWSQFEVEK